MSSIKIRTKRLNGKTQIRTLIAHPMESGLNRHKKTNELIPAHFIRRLTVKYNGEVIVTCNMDSSISKDPYFAFMLKGGNVGDKISISWVDNLGNKDTQSHIVNM
jgi:sulfur-oxidizing protein SoxZ